MPSSRMASERAKAEGYSDRVTYVLDDYRHITGEYDVFVSVGMLEHVGKQNYAELGRVVDRCLVPAGRALIPTIGRNRPQLMNAWIEKRIFPGAYPPTLREIMDILQPYNVSVRDVENLRLHYARTLEHWQARYNQAVDDLALARAICEALLQLDPNLILLALSGSQWVDLAKEMGVRVGREVFADRAMHSDGTLVSRSMPGSVVHEIEEVVERSLRMVTEGKSFRLKEMLLTWKLIAYVCMGTPLVQLKWHSY